MYDINTAILSNDFTGGKIGVISEINGHFTNAIALYPIRETQGFFPAELLLKEKQQLTITFLCDVGNYYIEMFSSCKGFTFAKYEVVRILFDNNEILDLHIADSDQGKLSGSPQMGYTKRWNIHSDNFRHFKNSHVAKILIENAALQEPAMLTFNPTLSPLYSTPQAGQMILREMADMIVKARIKICHDENVAMNYEDISLTS